MLVLEDAILKGKNKENFVALGSFDGLHKGHLSLIRKMKKLAKECQGQSIVYTFKNHPRKFINKNSTLNLIMTNEEKISILEQEGIDILAFKEFNKDIMEMSPEDFIKNICESFNIKGIVVGFNFKFGYKNSGDIKLLHELKSKYDFDLYVMEPCIYNESVVSSTRIRQSIIDGEVEEAFNMLTRPYSIKGKVIHGKKLGRTIGFPTANLEIDKSKCIPARGVYYTNVCIEGNIFKGITSVGYNPTVNGKELTIETNILDFNKDIYGQIINVSFIEKIREEIKFNNLEQLVNQLNIDKSYAEKNNIII
ncbi:MAG: bifunctional riboflavin kinase/FAD synthetase [Clostridium sp.]|nr:bifunctional riboflavin kinase/FAD synthetase [Clostridium sp.]